MWQLRLVSLACLGGGIFMLLFAVHIETTLRERRGTGFRRWLSSVFYTGEIEYYRNLTYHLMLFAPGLLVTGIGVWLFVSWCQRRARDRFIVEAMAKISSQDAENLRKQGLKGRRLAKALRALSEHPATSGGKRHKNKR
ncbi:MAG: hypothetical protein EA401_04250 [Planctomycetota bacterium]|nr:MAG: hypothetical protein EA401_04250 [Planctomycetota bacterium]